MLSPRPAPQLIDAELATRLLHDKIGAMPAESMTESAAGCLWEMFLAVNDVKGYIENDATPRGAWRAIRPDMVGIDLVWRAYLGCGSSRIVEVLAHRLVLLYLCPVEEAQGPDGENELGALVDLHKAFVGICSSHLMQVCGPPVSLCSLGSAWVCVPAADCFDTHQAKS